ncbi:MAG: excinuclease ABC subunit UvrC [Holosporales bacterium]|nr:excinuclease ABC subunit UvrC [Holosporales bacterium]
MKKAAYQAGMNPGIYKMLDQDGKVLYVGKAKHLKNRLLSYARSKNLSNRIRMMLSKVRDIEVAVVKTELEALLLESNLIKQLKPFYNILLKDDKTFPYIVIDRSSDFPRIFKYRTLKARGPNFYGPYPAINSLDETLKVIQKAFLIRNCTENYFMRRDRPCLQYFIKRCSAPCLGKISREEYGRSVDCAENLLRGKDEIARKMLIAEMREASRILDFERAASIRDRLKAISEIQLKQYIQISELRAIDFIAVAKGIDKSVVVISFFRIGKNVGSEKFVIQNSSENDDISDILESFIVQFYRNINTPELIVTNHPVSSDDNLSEELYEQNVKILCGKTGDYGKIIESCSMNAQLHLKNESTNRFENQIMKLQNLLKLNKINRIEAYDNSHLQGTNACGVMIVFEDGKIQKGKARKFHIRKGDIVNDGDDIGMMRFLLMRRFNSKAITEVPDIILIDGGWAQVSAARQIVDICGLSHMVKVIGIAKQNNRKIGDEKLILDDGEEVFLGPDDDDLLSFLIMLRNEAHRTAITFHRKKRSKSLVKSVLDDIPSIGNVRRKRLLEHFGSIDSIKKASIDDLKMVEGIDKNTAKLIFNFFDKGQRGE